jgi:ATP-dependent Clp protease ATP-binding subunit ClpB
MHESYLPKKAIEIAKEVAQQIASTRSASPRVTGEDVAKVIATKTGVPLTHVAEDEKIKLLHLEDMMHGRVIGQEEAVKAIASALRRARADVRSTSRPIASFLFLGPTGVGKTELAKTLAATYFGSEQMMIRVDMSEYQDVRSIDKLIGAPGSNQGGLFSEAVRTRPFSVVLLDELEKADPNILNVFLQILDDGRVTDAAGRVIDFTNTIIIATSNAGTQYIQDAVGRGEWTDQIKNHLLEEELRSVYRPEFLNRFDGVIVFKPLLESQLVEITKLMIAQITKRLEAKGIGFHVTDAEVLELAHKGYDQKFGARQLRRVVQEEVDNAIANALLEGKAQRRDTIVLDVGGVMSVQKGKEL